MIFLAIASYNDHLASPSCSTTSTLSKTKGFKIKPPIWIKKKRTKRRKYPFDRPPENILYRVGRCLPNVGVRLTDLEDTHELWRNIWVVVFLFIILIIIMAIMLYLQTLRMFSICIWFSACTTNFQAVVNLIATKKADNGKFNKPSFSNWRILVVVLFGS